MCILRVIFSLLLVVHQTFCSNNKDVFTIKTDGCTIPDLSKINEIIDETNWQPHFKNCSAVIRLINSNSTHIWVIRDLLDYFNIWNEAYFYCCYRNFSAINNIANISYGNCVEFTTFVKVEHEFVRVECYYSDDKMYDDFFLFENKELKTAKKSKDSAFNILIFGIESMSRLNFLRTMPWTSRFLRSKGSIQLRGYNKLGDNSLPNLFPVLTGHSHDYIQHHCVENYYEIDTNKCSLIWDTFSQAGFYTALASDSPAALLSTYEYNLKTIPTDFYLQPFIAETKELFRNQFYYYHVCMGGKYYFTVLLDYIKQFTIKLKHKKLFGLFWEESISHEHLNPTIMDEDYFDILNHLEESRYLDDTIIVFLSDHGMRFGTYVRTMKGRHEERLPLFEILFPDKFRRRYKLAFKHFQQNSNRLTTPFDIYNTLMDLIHPKELNDNNLKKRIKTLDKKANRSSLFVPIPEGRTCGVIGIAEHWCTCNKGEQIPANQNITKWAASLLVSHINNLLKIYPQCHVLNVEQILEATVSKGEHGMDVYTVILRTAPGRGIFHGTLVRQRDQWVVSGTVSRMNVYHNQSSCIDDYSLKLYCLCNK